MDEGEEEFGSQSQQSVRPTHSYSNPYENFTMEDESGNNNALTSSELSEIPRDYLNKLTVLKHLAKEVKVFVLIFPCHHRRLSLRWFYRRDLTDFCSKTQTVERPERASSAQQVFPSHNRT